MTVDTVVGNGLVVAPGGIIRGGVAIEGERIVAVGPDAGLPPARRRIEAGEGYIIPGFIDAHVHLGPGGVDWPPTARDFYTKSRAAAFGGVTSALVFLFSLNSSTSFRRHRGMGAAELGHRFSPSTPAWLQLVRPDRRNSGPGGARHYLVQAFLHRQPAVRPRHHRGDGPRLALCLAPGDRRHRSLRATSRTST